jgi:tyrosinase
MSTSLPRRHPGCARQSDVALPDTVLRPLAVSRFRLSSAIQRNVAHPWHMSMNINRRRFLTLTAAVPAASLLTDPGALALADPDPPALPVRKNILTAGVADKYVRALKALKKEASKHGLTSRYDDFIRSHFDAMKGVHGHPAFLPWHRAFLRDFEKECQRVLEDPHFGLPYWDWTADSTKPDAGGVWSEQILGGSGSPVTSGPFADKKVWPIYLPGGAGRTTLTRTLKATAGMAGTFPTGPAVHKLYQSATYNSFWSILENQLHNWIHVWVGGQMADVASSVNDPAFWLHHCNVDRIWAQWQRIYPKAELTAAGFPAFSATSTMPTVEPGGTGDSVGSVLDATTTVYTYDRYYEFADPFIIKIRTAGALFSGTDDEVGVSINLGRPDGTTLGYWITELDAAHCDHSNPFERSRVDTFTYHDVVFKPEQSDDLAGLLTPVCLRSMEVSKSGLIGSDDWKLGWFELSGQGWTIKSRTLNDSFNAADSVRQYDLPAPKF